MLDIIISLLTFVLILISLFLMLVILMQRANTNAGMGSAFGGGVAESAFGADTTNVLVKATKWAALAFFIISLVLYLLFISRVGSTDADGTIALPDIPVAEEPVQQESALPAQEDILTTAENVINAEAEQAAVDVVEEAEAAIDAFTGEPTAPAPEQETPPAP